ncbi:hypothetical protein PVAP13_9KG148685 [Panicum virgatum]|uniref:Uncharacterized protein n=1 Tax=Panicum virgatum TaxID=38727 RepID=A0A8T0NM02_PANVG|nr:hypothetical protein PVAP13_9KG148685 [Panicum virgatum]
MWPRQRKKICPLDCHPSLQRPPPMPPRPPLPGPLCRQHIGRKLLGSCRRPVLAFPSVLSKYLLPLQSSMIPADAPRRPAASSSSTPALPPSSMPSLTLRAAFTRCASRASSPSPSRRRRGHPRGAELLRLPMRTTANTGHFSSSP